MAWYAKPSGGYTYDSTEGNSNILMMNAFFSGRGYQPAAIAGIIGNVMAESALNPWRWQSDTYNLSGGYGLFQYTPASGYIDGAAELAGYAPNLSTTEQTTGASPTDGLAQCSYFDDNTGGKWQTTCWRSYWDSVEYADLYALREHVLTTWGTGAALTLTQFRAITNLQDATFAFLACFEGPAVPNLTARYANAQLILPIISSGGALNVPPWLLFKKGGFFFDKFLHR